MTRLADLYQRIQRDRCLSGVCCLALGLLGLLAINTMGSLIMLVLGVVLTCTVTALAIVVMGYLVYRGGKAVWQDITGVRNENSS